MKLLCQVPEKNKGDLLLNFCDTDTKNNVPLSVLSTVMALYHIKIALLQMMDIINGTFF